MLVTSAASPSTTASSWPMVGSTPSLTGRPGIRKLACSISGLTTYTTGSLLASDIKFVYAVAL